MSSPKRFVSLAKNHHEIDKHGNKENTREAYRTAEKIPDPPKTNIKSIKMVKPKPTNPRQSFHHGKNYQFNPRTSTSSFDSSLESSSFDGGKYGGQQVSLLKFQTGKGRQKLEEIDEDCLCEATPDKMKKAKNWLNFSIKRCKSNDLSEILSFSYKVLG